MADAAATEIKQRSGLHKFRRNQAGFELKRDWTRSCFQAFLHL